MLSITVMAGVRGVVTDAVTDVVMDEHRAEGTTLIPDETIRIFWVWGGVTSEL